MLVGAWLYVKGRSIPTLVGALAQHLRLPVAVRHVWLSDSGILSRPLLRALRAQGHFALGRVRCNQNVYFAPRRRSPPQRRPRVCGQACRVDQGCRRFPHWLREDPLRLRVRGRERLVEVFAAAGLLRGVRPNRALPARLVVVVVPRLKLTPGYLLCPDLDLDPVEVVLT